MCRALEHYLIDTKHTGFFTFPFLNPFKNFLIENQIELFSPLQLLGY